MKEPKISVTVCFEDGGESHGEADPSTVKALESLQLLKGNAKVRLAEAAKVLRIPADVLAEKLGIKRAKPEKPYGPVPEKKKKDDK